VRKNTLQIAEEIPEDKYGFRPADGTKSVAELLAHIALGWKFQEQINFIEKRTTLEGFDFPKLMGVLMAEQAKPRTKAELIALLQGEGEKFASGLEKLSDEFLGQSVVMPPGVEPPSRTRFDMLGSVKEHEMHHRGQLMLMERMLGITPHLTRAMNERIAAMQAAAAQAASQKQ
jgi:uncharacterized damage-inducible protein DinB